MALLCLCTGVKLKVIYQVVYLEEGHTPEWFIGLRNKMCKKV